MESSLTPKYAFRIKNQEQALSDMIDTFMSSNNYINDFTEGSVIRSLFESESIELEQLYYLTIENMKKTIDVSVQDAFGFETKDATYAYGNVLVVFQTPLSKDLYVPKGALFYSSNPLYSQEYRTQVPYVIKKGSTSGELEVFCTQKGTIGNVPLGTIDSCTDIGGYTFISQRDAITTGQDKESVDDAKVRFRKMIASLAMGTPNSIKYAVMNIDEVSSVYLKEDNYGEVIVYVCDSNGNLPDELKQKVEQVVALYKVAGVRFIVRPVHKSYAQLNVSVKVNNKLLLDNDFLTYINNTLQKYVNSLGIGENLYQKDIIQKVMDIDDLGVTNCEVGIKMSTDEQLASDSYISDGSPSYVGNTEVYQNQLVDPDIYQDGVYGIIGLPNNTINDKALPTWKSVLVANDVLNAGFHKDMSNDWRTKFGGHDIANIDKDNMYGNSNSLQMNIEDNGRNTYRYVETNKVPVNSGDIYSFRSELKATTLQDKGFMLPMIFSNYDSQKDMIPVPIKPSGANYNILPGTSNVENIYPTVSQGDLIYSSDNSLLQKGYVDNNNNGNLHPNTTDVATDLIPVEPNSYYTGVFSGAFDNTGVTRIVYFNSSKQYISYQNFSNLDTPCVVDFPVTPMDCFYIKVCKYCGQNNTNSNIQNYTVTIRETNEKGRWNTTKLSDNNQFKLNEPNLEVGATYTYSMYVNNLQCDSQLVVTIKQNDGNVSDTFTSKVYNKWYSGLMQLTFTIPDNYNTVNSIELYLESVDDQGSTPTIPYMRLNKEKLETGGEVTDWYLTKEEVVGKPLYVAPNNDVTGTTDNWVTSTIESVTIPDGYNMIAIRFYVQSFGIMNIAQPQINKSINIVPFRISSWDDTPLYELPYSEFYPLNGDVYVTAPNEIIRCSNVTVSFMQD